ncbi:MAG: hypothetical protein R3F59_05865 [Myxococcota bacterium]
MDLADGRAGPLGWCRGLCVAAGVAYVGFTRLRATRARRNVAWVSRKLRGTAGAARYPTRVEAWSLAEERRIGTWETAGVGLDAVFGLASAG